MNSFLVGYINLYISRWDKDCVYNLLHWVDAQHTHTVYTVFIDRFNFFDLKLKRSVLNLAHVDDHTATSAYSGRGNRLQSTPKTIRVQQLFRDFPGVSTAVAAFANHVAI